MKRQAAAEAGFRSVVKALPADVPADVLLQTVQVGTAAGSRQLPAGPACRVASKPLPPPPSPPPPPPPPPLHVALRPRSSSITSVAALLSRSCTHEAAASPPSPLCCPVADTIVAATCCRFAVASLSLCGRFTVALLSLCCRFAAQGLNADALIDGILVQLPLPLHIDQRHVLTAIDCEKDVDGFHPANMVHPG